LPITKSAKKAYVSSERKRAHNLVLKNKLKFSLKKVSKENTNETISTIDKMAKRHIISKNKAGHLKSRLAKKFGTPKKIQTSKSKSQNDNSKIKKTKVTEKPKTTKKLVIKPKISSKK